MFFMLAAPVGLGFLFYLERDVSFSAPFFLKNYLTKIIDESIPGHYVSIASVKVSTSQELSKIQIELLGINVQSLMKPNALYLKKGLVEFDLFDMIIKGERDYSIVLSNLPINLERNIENNLIIKLDQFTFLDNESLPSSFKPKLNNVKFVQLLDPKIVINDKPTKTLLRPNIASIDIDFTDDGGALVFQYNVQQQGVRDATMGFNAKYSYETGITEISTQIKNLLPSTLYTTNNLSFPLLKEINSPFSSSVNLKLSRAGKIMGYHGNLRGTDVISEEVLFLNKNFKLKDISLDFASSPGSSKVDLKNITVNSNFLISSGSGEIYLRDILTARINFHKFDLLTMPNYRNDFNFSNASFELDIDPITKHLLLKQALISRGTTELHAQGKISIGNSWGQDDYLKLSLFDINSDYIDYFRSIKLENFGSNIFLLDEVENLNFFLDWDINDFLEPRYKGHAYFSSGEVSFSALNGQVFDVRDGDISFNPNKVVISVDELKPKSGGPSAFELNNIQLTFKNLEEAPDLNFEAELKGDLNEVSNERLSFFIKKLSLSVDSLNFLGNPTAQSVVKGYLSAQFLSLDLSSLTSKSMTAAIKLDKCYFNLKPMTKPFTINQVNVSASDHEIVLELEGLFNDRPLLGSFKKVFLNDVASVFTVLWEPNLVDLKPIINKEFNFSGFGNLAVQTVITFPPNRSLIYRFKADLIDVDLTIPTLGFRKQIKDLGLLEFGWAGLNKKNFKFSSEGYELIGLAYFDREQKLETIKFHKVKLNDYFLGSALFSVGELENILNINGNMYDYQKSPKQSLRQPKKKLKVTVNLSKLMVRKDLVLNQFNGSFNFTKVLKGSGFGRLNGGPEVQVDLVLNNKKKSYKVFSSNAGDVLLNSNIYSSGYGGELNFALDQQPGQDSKGSIQIKKMRIIGAPFLAKLISLSSIKGILDLLGSNGMVFDEIKAEYSLNKEILKIKNGIAVSPSFGLTLSGTREMSKKIINYNGVLTPAYSLNRIVKKIPLIGSILGGNEGEGAIGINYFATGALRDPRVTVNPLSIIAPGKFRELLK